MKIYTVVAIDGRANGLPILERLSLGGNWEYSSKYAGRCCEPDLSPMEEKIMRLMNVALSLSTILLGGFTVQSCWAGTILLSDLTDDVQILPVSPRVIATCFAANEDCTDIHVLAPLAGATITNKTVGDRLTPFYIAEPDGLTVSDGIGFPTVQIGDPDYRLSFLSGQETVGGPCGIINICRYREDGTPQLVGTVTWSDGTIDTILIQSDINETVPEPLTILFIPSGLVLLVASRRRLLIKR